jgi:transcriptional regulator with XRE-family HTH domain
VLELESAAVGKVFGERLRQQRTLKKLSQLELANLADIPPSQVGRIERGAGNPTLRTMTALAKSLGISVTFLLEPY